MPPSLNKGYLVTGGSFLIWGLVPLFWTQLEGISAFELIHHRILWSLGFVAVLIALRGRMHEYLHALRSGSLARLSVLSGLLLTANWLIFIWAVHHGRVIETSLGYFIAPFVNTGLALIVLRERIGPIHALALGLAMAGVGIQLFDHGGFPWFALGLAFSFGFYGLLRKQSPLGSMTGLGVETTLLAPFAIGMLLLFHLDGSGALGRVDLSTHLWLAATGVVTAIPLLLFATGARLIPLSSVAILQFITPSVSLLLGVFVYREPFGALRLTSFILIWIGLALFLVNTTAKVSRPASPAPRLSSGTPV